jgi:hypothetical protein
MVFIVMFNNGAVLASCIEVSFDINDEYIVFAREIHTGATVVIQHLGDNKAEADKMKSLIHNNIVQHFARYSESVHDRPILLDFRSI